MITNYEPIHFRSVKTDQLISYQLKWQRKNSKNHRENLRIQRFLELIQMRFRKFSVQPAVGIRFSTSLTSFKLAPKTFKFKDSPDGFSIATIPLPLKLVAN